MDDTGRGANVNDEILCGETYFISIRTDEKREMKQVMGRMRMKEHGIAY